MKKYSLPILVHLIGLVILVSLPAYGFDFSELEKAVSEYTLDNGLKIIVLERHDAPVASYVTYVNVGGANDPLEYAGLAHMFEHMAFKGTMGLGSKDIENELKAMAVEDSIWYELRAERKMGARADSARLAVLGDEFQAAIDAAREYVIPNAFDQILEREGAVGINAGTGKDQTQYYMSLPSNRLELWMAMESERFVNPVLREMYAERMVIAEERRQTLENNPIMNTLWTMMAVGFTAHPYGVPIVGHMSDIMNYTRDAAKAYYDKYYVASNMILGIAGDVDPDQVFKLAEKYFGRLPKRDHPEELATVEPPQEGERRVMLEDPSQPLFACCFHIPEDTHPDWPALNALGDYLGQGRTSLLYTNLVNDKKIAADIGAFPGWPGSKDPCMFVAYAMPTPGHTNEECEEQVFAEIEKLKEELIPAEEVEKIKARAKAQFINGLQSNMGMAQQLVGYQNGWGDWRELFKELDRINAVTPEDIQRVAKLYLTSKNRTVAKLNTVES